VARRRVRYEHTLCECRRSGNASPGLLCGRTPCLLHEYVSLLLSCCHRVCAVASQNESLWRVLPAFKADPVVDSKVFGGRNVFLSNIHSGFSVCIPSNLLVSESEPAGRRKEAVPQMLRLAAPEGATRELVKPFLLLTSLFLFVCWTDSVVFEPVPSQETVDDRAISYAVISIKRQLYRTFSVSTGSSDVSECLLLLFFSCRATGAWPRIQSILF